MLQTTSTYRIKANAPLEQSKLQTLFMLYQPIILHDALSLYLTLYGELKQQSLVNILSSHYRLFLLTGLDMKQIELAIKKLEAIGLVHTYVKEDDYIYELLQPLSPSEFLNDPMLSVLLARQMGQLEYDKTRHILKAPVIEMENYTDVTASFNDVYQLDIHSTEGIEVLSIKETYMKHQIKTPKLSYDKDLLLIQLKTYHIDPICINQEVDELLGKYCFMYQLDALDLAKLLTESYHQKQIDVKKLSQLAAKYYDEKIKPKELVHVYHQQSAKLKGRHLNNENLVFKRMDETSPYEYLRYLLGHQPSKRDLLIVESIMTRQKLEPGVMNVILDYTVKKEGRIVKNYMEAIASTFASNQIQTVEMALNEIRKSEQHKKQTQTITKQKIDYQPEKVQTSDISFDDIMAMLKED